MDINRQRRRRYRDKLRRRLQSNANEEEEDAMVVLTGRKSPNGCGRTWRYETVRQLIQDGVNVNCVKDKTSTPLWNACGHGFDEIVRILLDVGANPRWSACGYTCLAKACSKGHLSIVELLVNHDKDLLEFVDICSYAPIFAAIYNQQSHIVRFLLDRGANVFVVWYTGTTTLMSACSLQGADLEIVRMLIAADVNVEARGTYQKTALHCAADCHGIEVVRELILQQNANMFAVDHNRETPFDFVCRSRHTDNAEGQFLDICGNKMRQDHGRLALPDILSAPEYSFAEAEGFHPPLSPLRIILPLGKLALNHFRTLLHSLGTDLLRNRDDSGKLPIHIACRTNAPVEVLALLSELDLATLHIADHSGALPIHECCYGEVDNSTVQYLVEQGGVGTLAARNREGALPLHFLCGSNNPSLQMVQYLIESFPGSVAARTNAGQYPVLIAAVESSSATLSVVYELARSHPGAVVPR